MDQQNQSILNGAIFRITNPQVLKSPLPYHLYLNHGQNNSLPHPPPVSSASFLNRPQPVYAELTPSMSFPQKTTSHTPFNSCNNVASSSFNASHASIQNNTQSPLRHPTPPQPLFKTPLASASSIQRFKLSHDTHRTSVVHSSSPIHAAGQATALPTTIANRNPPRSISSPYIDVALKDCSDSVPFSKKPFTPLPSAVPAPPNLECPKNLNYNSVNHLAKMFALKDSPHKSSLVTTSPILFPSLDQKVNFPNQLPFPAASPQMHSLTDGQSKNLPIKNITLETMQDQKHQKPLVDPIVNQPSNPPINPEQQPIEAPVKCVDFSISLKSVPSRDAPSRKLAVQIPATDLPNDLKSTSYPIERKISHPMVISTTLSNWAFRIVPVQQVCIFEIN